MNQQWSEKLFNDFIQLRDALRAAKRDKNYQNVLSLGMQILELDNAAGFLEISTPIFLTAMAEACIKLGSNTAAEKYFMAAKNKFTELKIKSNDWQKYIDVIDRKLEKLQATSKGPTHHSTGLARKAAQSGEFKR
ncbi:MAG TPA: hypothetical protein DCP03_01735 [Polaromonas sp.]|uniref:hypothetical protein n=1 Tax=Polaromonas sp. UBA4122 TaxID=1947074 RepID=UPI000EEFCDC8|nr:hypothetical protein [Polaromonas sp. UBA4122]HAL36895.1 hypothetical protein [Polaromonas sp.]